MWWNDGRGQRHERQGAVRQAGQDDTCCQNHGETDQGSLLVDKQARLHASNELRTGVAAGGVPSSRRRHKFTGKLTACLTASVFPTALLRSWGIVRKHSFERCKEPNDGR